MSFLKSIFCGRKVEPTPDVIKELLPGEIILHGVEQARIEQPISPDCIYITTERVMFRGPIWFGLMTKNRDYRYEDMGNITVRRNLLNSDIHVKMRFLTYDICLKAIPNEEAPLIARTIQEGIDGRFAHIGQGSHALKEKSVSVKQEEDKEEIAKILKLRYAKGEITKEEYEKLKKELLQ